MLSIYKKTLFSVLIISSASAVAANPLYEINGQTKTVITTNTSHGLNSATAIAGENTHSVLPGKKAISLMRIKLSKQGHEFVSNKAKYQLKNMTSETYSIKSHNAELPSKVELGMNGVPVLDQGAHGSCVTFATTGALDAAYSQGDYISQLCNLSLGSYLHNQDSHEDEKEKYPSGWDGSFNEIVLKQISDYGIVPKHMQRRAGCAGVFEYPVDDETNTGNPMSIKEFSSLSENIMASIATTTIMKIQDTIDGNAQAEKSLNQIKQSLADGNRITFATLLVTGRGSAGAVGSYKSQNDTWVLTADITRDTVEDKIDAGHAMVITGYDDNVFITDKDGNMHKGILYLRNSWGYDAGDYGNFYMTYDYFKTFSMEAYGIVRHH